MSSIDADGSVGGDALLDDRDSTVYAQGDSGHDGVGSRRVDSHWIPGGCRAVAAHGVILSVFSSALPVTDSCKKSRQGLNVDFAKFAKRGTG